MSRRDFDNRRAELKRSYARTRKFLEVWFVVCGIGTFALLGFAAFLAWHLVMR